MNRLKERFLALRRQVEQRAPVVVDRRGKAIDRELAEVQTLELAPDLEGPEKTGPKNRRRLRFGF